MGRLKALGPSLGRLPPRVGFLPREEERTRTEAHPWRAWYKTARWQRLSWAVRLEAMFTCARCGRVEGRKGQSVADHVRAHRGDETLFWDRANLQCLCKGCHDRVKQAEEAADPARGLRG